MTKLVTIIAPDEKTLVMLTEAIAQAGMDDFCACATASPQAFASTPCRLVIGDAQDQSEGMKEAEGTEYFPAPARLGTVLERAFRLRDLQAMREQTDPVPIGPYILYPAESALRTQDPGAAPMKLTDKEVQILQILAAAAPEGVSRQILLERVWGYAPNIETHTLETHIYRLRQKIEPGAAAPSLLITQDAAYKLRI